MDAAVIVAVPAAAGALVCAFRGHWILGAALIAIALIETFAEASARRSS